VRTFGAAPVSAMAVVFEVDFLGSSLTDRIDGRPKAGDTMKGEPS
jgi:hypothetical protein